MFTMAAMLFTGYSAGAGYTPVPGDVIKVESNATVYVVDDSGQRIPLSAAAYQVRYNNNFSLIKIVTEAEMGARTENILNVQSSVSNGTLIMYETEQPGIFIVENGYKRVFSTWQGFTAKGYELSQVTWIGLYTKYPTGVPVQ